MVFWLVAVFYADRLTAVVADHYSSVRPAAAVVVAAAAVAAVGGLHWLKVPLMVELLGEEQCYSMCSFFVV